MGPIEPFEIREQAEPDGFLRLSVRGELDLATAPELENALADSLGHGRGVRLDLSALRFIDSTGIQLLIGTLLDARAAGRPFELDPNLSTSVARVLEISGVRAVLVEHAPGSRIDS